MEQTVNETTVVLTKGELSFFHRVLRNRKLFRVFSFVGIGVAVFLVILYTVVLNNMNGTRFALLILILLQAWANLKLFKAATIIQKLNVETKVTGE